MILQSTSDLVNLNKPTEYSRSEEWGEHSFGRMASFARHLSWRAWSIINTELIIISNQYQIVNFDNQYHIDYNKSKKKKKEVANLGAVRILREWYQTKKCVFASFLSIRCRIWVYKGQWCKLRILGIRATWSLLPYFQFSEAWFEGSVDTTITAGLQKFIGARCIRKSS